MIKVFVSGCFDIVHGGHVEFFRQAKELGDYLVVSFASDEVLLKYKNRISALPMEHKKYLLENLKMVDKVYSSTNTDDPIFDFKDAFIKEKANILATTTDDKNFEKKKLFCEANNAKLVILPKSLSFKPISTTEIRERILKE
jgi:cytidyltransferase-like protein